MLKNTHGILLKKTIMANDDGVLDFFTSDFGKITCFVPKLARSKKKAGELDFFRLLELGIFEGRNSKRLTSVSTQAIFHGFEKSYKIAEMGFNWLAILGKVLPIEKPSASFFKDVVSILGHCDTILVPPLAEDVRRNIQGGEVFLEAFFWVKLFCFMGIFPRFDRVKDDVWVDLLNFHFFSTENLEITFIDNRSRQVLEFLRRSDFEQFLEKRMNLPVKSANIVEKILKEIKQLHL